MELGIFARTFGGRDALSVFSAARSAGYSCVQFNMACLGLPSMPDAIGSDAIRQIADASAATGVAIAAVSGTYNMIHPDPAIRKEGLRRLGVLVGSAHALGTRLVTLCTGSRDPYDQWRRHPDNGSLAAWRDLLEEMERALTLAEAHDVDLGIEPELTNVVSSPILARQLLDTIPSPRLAIVLDPANLLEAPSPPEQQAVVARAIDLLADRIVMAHAKDRAADGRFVAPGAGVVDFSDFVARLKRIGFKGPLVTHGLKEHEAPPVAAFLKRVLAQ